MKILITFLSLLLTLQVLQGQNDTVVFHIDQISASGGDSQCIILKADNFENIASAQLGFSWDTTLVELDTIRDGVLTNTKYNNHHGSASFSWYDIVGKSATSDEALIELCFTSKSDNTSLTTITISPLPSLDIEVYNIFDVQLAVEVSGIVYSPSSGHINCDTDAECLESYNVSYEGDTIIIEPQDLVSGSLTDYLTCNNTSQEHIALINLSSDEPAIGNTIKLYCGNLQETVYIAIAVKNEESPQYWTLCHVPVVIANIPTGDCKNSNISFSDPSICKDVTTSTTTSEFLLTSSDLLNVESTPGVEYTYFNNEYGWEYGQVTDEVALELVCEDFNQTLFLNTSLIIAAPEGPPGLQQIIIPEFCSHKIDIAADTNICNTQVQAGQVEIRIDGLPSDLKPSAYINNNEIERLGIGRYSMDPSTLLDMNNVFHLDQLENHLGVAVTTLDLVLMIQALRELTTFTPHQVIAADIDRSGSLTTKDILTLRKLILAIISSLDNGSIFIAETEDNLPELDVLDFNNVYQNYQFDKSEIDAVKGLDLFAGVLGNVNLEKRVKTKNLKMIDIQFSDQLLVKNEIEKIHLTIDSENDLQGFLLNFESDDLDIINVSTTHSKTAILSNKTTQDYKVSYIDVDHRGDIELELEVQAHRTILLSHALQLSQDTNEGVSSSLEEFQLRLAPQLSQPSEFKAYPNPTDQDLIVDIPTEFIGGTISLSSVLGKVIWNQEIVQSGQKIIPENVLGQRGILILRIENDNHKISKKIFTN